MTPYEAYIAFLGRLGDALEELTAIEKEKTDAVRRDDLVAVNECMKREQALSLSFRSMDNRRVKLLKELGLEKVTLSQFAAACPPELRQEAAAAAESVRNRYAVYRSAAALARETLERNLRQIDDYLEEHGAGLPPEEGSVRDFRA